METIKNVFTDVSWSPYAADIGIGLLSWLKAGDYDLRISGNISSRPRS
ncbi:MAG: hypothetical protein R6W81_14815 [Bacteroidales bacterium]